MEEIKMQIAQNSPVICADDCIIDNAIKVHMDTQNDQETIHKTGKVTLMCVDQQTKTIVGRVILDPFTAKRLGELLTANTNNLIKEIQSSELSEEMKQKIRSTQAQPKTGQTYIG